MFATRGGQRSAWAHRFPPFAAAEIVLFAVRRPVALVVSGLERPWVGVAAPPTSAQALAKNAMLGCPRKPQGLGPPCRRSRLTATNGQRDALVVSQASRASTQ